MKILILASRFFMGGFSRSLINFLLCADKYPELDITVLTIQKNEIEDYKEIPKRFQYIAIDELKYSAPVRKGFNAKYLFNIQRIRNIEHVLTEMTCRITGRPFPYKTMIKFMSFSEAERAGRVITDFSFCKDFDVAVSWEELFCNYLLVQKIPVKHKIGYIHPNYEEVGFSKAADKKYLKKLDRIVTISQSCYTTLLKCYPEYQDKIVCLPNRLYRKRLYSFSEEYTPSLSKNIFILLTVCRLSDPHKAIFRIADLCERLIARNIDYKWYLIGDGPDYKKLNKLIQEKKIGNHLICLGAIYNPYPYMKSADIYVQQSYYEGRPVSVDEAMLLGTPALITNYSSAYEQVDDSVDGWIVENDEDKIYEKLKYLLDHPEEVERVRDNLKHKDFSAFEDCTPFINMINELTNE